jgi:4-diphosphocytidyl-2-C-methyl-D-erythritol kinase
VQLDPETAMSLAPESLVTMMLLSGTGDAVAGYAAYALYRLGDAYDAMDKPDLAQMRRDQAVAIADSFGADVHEVPQDERNIAFKAARLYLESFEISGYSVNIQIDKSIPVCAGLAGGSTDAAATLTALNSLFGEKARNDELLECAAKLGSDVPFCLEKGTKLTKGRGEQMISVPEMPDCTVLICSSGESVSTAWAYAELDRIHGDFAENKGKSVADFVKHLEIGEIKAVAENMYNIFEDAVFPVCPLAKNTKELLLSHGAINAMMSGSGSSVFGIFPDEKTALEAKTSLETSERKVFLCKPQ